MASQSISEASLKTAITERLETSHVDITDQSGGCGQAFIAVIVSSEFAGKITRKRHQLVNSALKEEIAAIHAWTPKCYTPEEWQKQKSQAAAIPTEPPQDGTVGGKVEGTTA